MKIICIGRNYAKHATELKNEIPSEPVFFLKPDSSILKMGKKGSAVLFYPDFTNELHYEVELVIKISKLGKHIDKKYAYKYYREVGLGVDFTARDVQRELKKKGLPWEKAKAFDQSAALSTDFLPVESVMENSEIHFSLDKNNQTVQVGNSKNMLFSIDEIISWISQFITLKIGDLIYTGTPSGVGEVQVGDELIGQLGGKEMMKIRIK